MRKLKLPRCSRSPTETLALAFVLYVLVWFFVVNREYLAWMPNEFTLGQLFWW